MEDLLKAHVGAICAVDFFSVKVLTPTGLVRTLVLFAIDLKSGCRSAESRVNLMAPE